MISIVKLFELNKTEKMIASGKLSPKSIKKAKKHGVIRSEDKYMSGIRKGTDRIKGSAPIKKSILASFIGPTSVTKLDNSGLFPKVKHQINKPYISIKPMFRGKAADIGMRHEADEIKAKEKQDIPHAVEFRKNGKIVGMHASPKVLKDEKKIVDFTSNAYGIGENLKKFRKKTGEYDFVDKLNPAKIRKIEKRTNKKTLDTTVKLQSHLDKMQKHAVKKQIGKMLKTGVKAFKTLNKKEKINL